MNEGLQRDSYTRVERALVLVSILLAIATLVVAFIVNPIYRDDYRAFGGSLPALSNLMYANPLRFVLGLGPLAAVFGSLFFAAKRARLTFVIAAILIAMTVFGLSALAAYLPTIELCCEIK